MNARDILNSAGVNVPHYWPSPSNPTAVARELLLERMEGDRFTLRHHRGMWREWTGPDYSVIDEFDIAAWIYRKLEKAKYLKVVKEVETPTAWLPNKSSVANVLDAMAKLTGIPTALDAPAWLDGDKPPDGSGRLISVANGLVDPSTGKQHEHSVGYFNDSSVPFEYDPAAPEPVQWLKFLNEVLPGDIEAIETLQEWFGYILSGRTDLQKILLLAGKPRAGKGTILRVLTALMGAENVTSPSMGDLGGQFGLMPLIGKPLAIIPDARISGRGNTGPILERLLSISGEDSVSVNRKGIAFWQGRLPTRFVLATNEPPRFPDSAGAFVSRLVMLTFEQSFVGRENEKLSDQLIAEEMGGILRWAMTGLTRLEQRRRFRTVTSSVEELEEMRQAASPHYTFAVERCQKGGMALPETLYAAWKAWAPENGIEHPGTVQSFSRQLRAAWPDIKIVRPRINGVPTRHYHGISLKGAPPVWLDDVPENRQQFPPNPSTAQ